MKNEHKSEVIHILCVNDFHAGMDEDAQSPGAAKLVAAVEEFCESHENTLVLFGGDNYMGNPAVEYLDGKPISELMRRLEVKASSIGNHEFDFGLEAICRWQRDGGFRFLACNLVDDRTGRLPEEIRPYEIFSVGGKRILVIGLALPERLGTADRPEEMKNYHILSNKDTIGRIRTIYEETRNEIDGVIVLTHYGLRYREGTMELAGEELLEVCREVPYLDGAFAAHLHQYMADYAGGVPVAQGGNQGRGFAWMRMIFRDGRLACTIPGFEDLRGRKDRLCPDKKMKEQWEGYRAQAMKVLGKTIAVLEEPVRHRNERFEADPCGTPFSYMATELMRELTGCPISLFYSGRIGTGFDKGELTLYHAESVLIFENKIVTAALKGSTIRKNVETGLSTLAMDNRSPIAVAGLRVLADFSREHGSRIIEITLENGEPLDMDAEYQVAMDEFMADSQMGFDFSEAKNMKATGIPLKRHMIEKIEKDGGISLSFPRAIVRADSGDNIKGKGENGGR